MTRKIAMNALQRHDARLLASCDWLIGIDEAGRGALAGPVVAGACLISADFFNSPETMELSAAVNDSKQLGAEAREAQFVVIEQLKSQGLLDFEVAAGSVQEIAELNILGATRLAMRRAVEALAARASDWALQDAAADGPLFQVGTAVPSRPLYGGRTLEGKRPYLTKLIVDGRPLKPFPYTHEGIVKGDGKSLSIAMASIAAKVIRDRDMKRLAVDYPGYGLEGHKGYGTKSHRTAILAHGASPIHRELFLRKILAKEGNSGNVESHG